VKSCVLLAALHAEGETVVREAVPTRRHTEELLEICGGDIEESSAGSGHSITVRPSELGPFELEIPGDPSQAAFWIVAACIVPGSEIHLPDVYAGSGRRGFLDVLLRMGADIDERSTSERESVSLGASSDIVVRSSPLRGTEIHAEEITGLDEVPILAVAAALAEGSTTFFDVGELRVKESDRLAGIVGLLEAFGARGEISGDNLIVHGASGLAHGHVQSKGDHRMAMSAAVAGLAATGDGTTTIEGWESVQTSYPGFADDLETLAGSGSRP
jgi:3-phosphoshikimate 1-carboxyvinyltransferase